MSCSERNLWMLLLCSCISACTTKVLTEKLDNGVTRKEHYDKDVLVFTEFLKHDTLIGRNYFSYTGIDYRLIMKDRRGRPDTTIQKYYYVDSAFVYDSLGRLESAVFYSKAVPQKRIEYWASGAIKSVFVPISIDTAREYEYQVILGMILCDWEYEGEIKCYDESGRLWAEGRRKNYEPYGIWIYYLESGEIDHRDTLQ